MYTFKILCIAAKIQIKWVNVDNTRTNICYGCNTRTNHKNIKKKEKIATTHAFQNHEMIYCYIPSSCKALATSQNFLKESMHSCMRTCKQSSWGVCWAAKRPHFIHHFIYYLSPYSIISFHKTINIHHFHNKYGFILLFSKSFIFEYFEWIYG